MELNPSAVNKLLLFKLPSAFICGVRVRNLSDFHCDVTVKHRWINQNPFKSMYFAVQSMAAELSTGALVMGHAKASGARISMLVTGNSATYLKKAVGKIHFTCTDGGLVSDTIRQAVSTGEAQKMILRSTGVNADGQVVSEMTFEWSIKAR